VQALDLLLNRSSQPRLTEPAPEGIVLENIMQAALRAPDHRCLTPWQFIVCKGKGLVKLGEVFEQAAINSGVEQAIVDRAMQLPLRAPMVIVAICKYKEDDKVPWVEQVASTACAVHSMQHWRRVFRAFGDPGVMPKTKLLKMRLSVLSMMKFWVFFM
jgi:nitroreductase